jgi:hypothetical protein
MLPLQQFFPEHELRSQTQVPEPLPAVPPSMFAAVPPPEPDWHSWPARHSVPLPHMHIPPEQTFASGTAPGLQLTHWPASAPQAASVLPIKHRLVTLSQQPAHVALQTQAPPMQVSPALHAAPVLPQTQLPLTSQLSVVVGLQLLHVPLRPHRGHVCVMQLMPLQHRPAAQPPGQPLHTPPLHMPGEQLRHSPPSRPHKLFAVPA